MISRKLFALGFSFCLLAISASPASAVTVQEVSVGRNEIVAIDVPGFYSGGVYAGIVNMKVDGVAQQGLCIDPFHWSNASTLQYNYALLKDAPKFPMGAAHAATISKLWTLGYADALASNEKAAGLQIAIWETVAGSSFSLTSGNDYGAQLMLDAAASYSGPVTKLIALRGPSNGQDYVIQGVPDAGSTLLLFSVALLGVVGLRQRFGFGASSAN